MARGFKMGSAFVEVGLDDSKVDQGRDSIGSTLTKWAGGLALGAVISKGITDNLEIGQANAKLGAQLNLTKDVANQAGKIAGEVYRDNFGASIPEVNAAIASVGQNLLNLNTASKESIKGATESALGLASVFDQDVNEVIRAAGQLVKNNLAPNFEVAFDQITRAFQTGGNVAGDLLETINEYSPQFAKLGFDGATALGILSAGLQAGARDGDVMADVFKEFGLRAIDTAKLTTDGYEAIGLKADDMRAKVAAGGKGASDAMVEVLRALQNMKDPVAQNAAGVALFGTQWEDTLRAILPKMDITEAALTDVEGATQRMNDQMGDTGAAKVESVKRAMEGWVTTMTGMEGPLGSVSAWVVGFGGAAIPMLGSIGQIIMGFGALQGTAVASMAATVATTVGGWAAMAAKGAATAVVMAAQWVLAFWPIALIVAAVAGLVYLVVTNWDSIKNTTVNVWNAIWKFVSDLITKIANWVRDRINDIVRFFGWLGSLPGKVRDWFVRMKDGAIAKLGELVNWVKSIPGKIMNAIGNLGRLLFDAGKKILQGLWDGLKAMWENVKNWVGNVGDWISDLKGPIEVDAVILLPHGKAFMEGLKGGLESGFETEVKPTLAGMAGDIGGMTISPPSVGSPVRGSDGAAAPGDPRDGAIIIENLTVTFPGSLNAMSKTDLRTTAEFLRDQIRNVDRSQRASGAVA